MVGVVVVSVLAVILLSGRRGGDPPPAVPSWPDDVSAPATTAQDRSEAMGSAVGRLPTGADPLRVVSIGDSVAYDADPGIRAALESTGRVVVVTRSFGGVGLLRPDFDRYLADTMATRPEVVTVMLGGWDLAEAVADPARYNVRLEEVADRLTRDGALVVWLGMPPSPPSEGIEGARLLINSLFTDLGRSRSDVVYVSTESVLGGATGRFSRFLPGLDGSTAQVRKVREGRDDGHLCPAGAALIGDSVYTAVGGLYPLPARADRWWSAEWTDDPRYDDPPGGCRSPVPSG